SADETSPCKAMTWRQCGTSVHRQPAAATNLVAWLRSILAFTGKGVPSMCDYSLHHVATRPARVGDKLVATRFPNSITRGFAASGEPHVAVCLMPGTEIAFDQNVECEPSFGIGILPNKKIGQRLARFRQINMDNAVTHHDALEFPDGQLVLLTRLCEGQRATVLQLPAAAHPAPPRRRRGQRPASLPFRPKLADVLRD